MSAENYINGKRQHDNVLMFPRFIGSNTVRRFATAAARDAAIPSPVDGMVVENEQISAMQMYDADNSVWRTYGVNIVDRLPPDWWWDCRQVPIANGEEITSWSSRTPGTVVAAAPLGGGAGPLMDTDGLLNAPAADFNGTSQGLVIADQAHEVDDIACAVFFQADGNATSENIFAHWDSGTNQRSWQMQLRTGNNLRVYLSDNGTTIPKDYLTTGGCYTANEPTLLGFQLVDGVLTIWANGVSITALTKGTDDACATIHNSTAELSIGYGLASGAASGYFDGLLQHAMIFNRGLRAEEWAALYAGLFI